MANELPNFNELQKKKAGNALPSFSDLAKPGAQKATPGAKGPQHGGPYPKKVKPKQVRPRRAKNLSLFKSQIGSSANPLFYRYIRVIDGHNDGLAGPKGGACILVNMVSDDAFSFSFSVCSLEDPFVKDEARRLCQERMAAKMSVAVTRRNRDLSCYENILNGIENFLLAGNGSTGMPQLVFNGNLITNQQLKLLARFIRNYYRQT